MCVEGKCGYLRLGHLYESNYFLPSTSYNLFIFIHSVLRKRIREDRKANTAQKVQQMKQRLNETERKRKRWLYWQPFLTKMGFLSVILIGAFVGWTLFFQQSVL